MDKLSTMQAFCRIVERGNFARAAEDLGVSSALLSREMRLLEDSLGTTLLTRTTRRMSLTEAGRIYYRESLGILEAVNRVEDHIRDGAGAMRGHLKVNASNSFGQLVIAPFLPGFMAAFPDLRITLSLNDRVVDMVEGGYDVSIRIRSAMPDSTLISRKIGTVQQGIFAAPRYIATAGLPTRLDDIPHHKVLGFLFSDHLTTWEMVGPDGPCTLAVDPTVRVESSIVLRDLLVAGAGIGTLPSFVSDGLVARGELLRLMPDYSFPQRDICAVTAARLGMDARVLAFLDRLKATLKD
jgi:DNA-binding transcriptional LysR family regulator